MDRLRRPPDPVRPRSGEPPWTPRSPRSTRRSDDVYGSPRILADLREDGETVSRKTVAASMRRQRLQGHQPTEVHPRHHHPGRRPGQPGRPRRPGLGHRPARSGLDLRYHVSADRAGLGLFVCGPRRVFPPRHRVGDGRPHAHRTCHRRVEHGSRIPRAAATESCLSRGPRLSIHVQRNGRICRLRTGWHVRSDGPGCVGTTPSRNRTGQA